MDFLIIILCFVEKHYKESFDGDDEFVEGEEPDIGGDLFKEENDVVPVGEEPVAIISGYFIEFEVPNEDEEAFDGQVLVLVVDLVEGHRVARLLPVLAIVLEQLMQVANPGLIEGTAAVDESDSLIEDHDLLYGLRVALLLGCTHLLDLCLYLVLDHLLEGWVAEWQEEYVTFY